MIRFSALLPISVPFECQGATKTVSTCPRQVVLASGQVGCQSYLSFGQVNESQKIIFKKKQGVLNFFSGEISLQRCTSGCTHNWPIC